jgi:hypothetical protein
MTRGQGWSGADERRVRSACGKQRQAVLPQGFEVLGVVVELGEQILALELGADRPGSLPGAAAGDLPMSLISPILPRGWQ